MKTNLKFILLASASVLAAVVLAVQFLSWNHKETASAASFPIHSRQQQGNDREMKWKNQTPGTTPEQGSAASAPSLQTALAEKDPARRKELLRQWALSVPLSVIGEMMERVGSLSEPPLLSEARYALATRWAAREPAAAAAMLREHAGPLPGMPDGNPEWVDLLGGVAAQWGDADANQAVKWVRSLPDGAAKSEALAQVDYQLRKSVDKLAANDPQAAAAWVRGLPADEAVEGAMTSLAKTWAQKDPAAAVAYTASLAPGNARNRATAAAVSTWAFAQPVQAAQWVGQLSEGPVRENAMEALLAAWANNDAGAAAQWLQDLPETRSRDVAINAFAAAVTQREPSSAFQWAETISDPTLRNQQLQNVAGIWLQRDPVAAKSKVAQSSLPQRIKSLLLTGATPQRP